MTSSRTHLQADLLADLEADLEVPEEPAPPVALEPAPAPPPPGTVTPAVSLQLTPLRWSRPRVVRAEGGAGKALRLGPVRLEVSVKQ